MYVPLYYFIAITGSVAFKNAHFGRGVGPITLDNVACTSSEMSLLACRHNKLFMHNCNHQKDAGVRCNNDSERIKNITASAIATSSASAVTVFLSWELQNTTLDEPLRFEVECLNERHRVSLPDYVGNKTNSTDLFGLLRSSHYNCCVSAVYGLYATSRRKKCIPIEIPQTMMSTSPALLSESTTPSTLNLNNTIHTSSVPSSSISNSTSTHTETPEELDKTIMIAIASASMSVNTVGGVLGFVVCVLLILLAILVAAVVYLLWTRHKNRTETGANTR